MTWLLRGVALLAAAILLSFSWTWATQVGPLDLYLEGQAPPGQAAYLAMRWLGLFAFFLMWLQLMAGILLPVQLVQTAEARAEVVRFHTWAGLLTLLAVVLHPVLFLAGIMERTQRIRWDMLYPVADQGFYQFYISFGVVGLYLVAIASAAALLRNVPALRRSWVKVHWLNGLAFALVAVHCWKIGSETRLLGVALPLTLALAAVAAALLRRRAGRR